MDDRLLCSLACYVPSLLMYDHDSCVHYIIRYGLFRALYVMFAVYYVLLLLL